MVKTGVKEAYFDRTSGVRKGKRQVFYPATGCWAVVKSRVNAHRIVGRESSSNKRIEPDGPHKALWQRCVGIEVAVG
jgi:hypothetical protein